MLILKAPVGLMNRSDYITADDSFYNRINANYTLMGSDIGNADLLHAVTSPPEIFIGEGDITTVAGNTFINNKNEEKLEIINNLLNRITVNAGMPLTYQDRVYISDVLYKIGIKNDALFMREVSRIREENENTNNFIDEILVGGEEARDRALKQYVNNFIRNIERKESPESERVMETYLGREITERLKTGAIYQILANFNSTISNKEFSRNEYLISEQARIAREMLAERFMEQVVGERGELVFKSENIYEEEFLSEEHEGDTVSNEITAAVLLDMVRNLFVTSYDKVHEDSRKWFEFRNILFNSSDNTLSRLNYITSDAFTTAVVENIESTVSMEFPSAGEEEEVAESRVNAEETALIRQLTEINERNVRNMERYRHMLSVIDRVREKRGRTDGAERTRNAAREVLRSDVGAMDLLRNEEEERLESEKTVFHEIERLFPEEYRHIFEVLNQYRENSINTDNTIVTSSNISSLINDIENVKMENLERELVYRENTETESIENTEIRNLLERERVMTERAGERRGEEAGEPGARRIHPELQDERVRNIEETTETREKIRERSREISEEIKKARQRENAAPSGQTPGRGGYPEAEIVHKSSETITREDIEETLNEYRRSSERKVSSRDIKEESIDRRERILRSNEENLQEISENQIQDIQALIDQGVRNRMNSISNEVMQRLERRLSNEKARRGI